MARSHVVLYVSVGLMLSLAGCSCSSDTTVPNADGGPDTGVPPADGGPRPDTGVPPVDTGVPPVDTGVPPVDTGMPPVDGGGPSCGNGVLDTGETCDTAIAAGMTGACPTSCDDGMACTVDMTTGSACTAGCTHAPITTPAPGDGCCPSGATMLTDSDCAATCGNGVVETGETCDTGITSGAGACPTAAACNDMIACTTDALAGSACTAMCTHTPITMAGPRDMCCPSGATPGTDPDCAGCGDGVVGAGETCDTAIAAGMAGACPTSCNDGMACTTDMLVGGGTCTAACSHTAITMAGPMDGCCPSGANHNTDTDCTPMCGNSVIEGPTETCDPPAAGTCSATCQTIAASSTAFRVTTASIISPHVVYNVPLSGCRDLTNTGVTVLGMSIDSLNNSLQASLDSYGLNIVDVFRPVNPAAATSPNEVYVNATCMAGPPVTCAPAATMSMSTVTTATNMASGTCYAPVTADVNPHCMGAGTCTGGYGTVNTIMGPCFSDAEATIIVQLTVAGSTVNVPLTHARVVGTYTGSPTSGITPGVITGFLSAVTAADTAVTLPVIGTRRLYNFLQAGGATQRDSMGTNQASSCNFSGGAVEDDRDTLADGTVGFWFFLNVALTRTNWTGP